MLPACFDNFIGASRDCEILPISGLYLTDLEGISLEVAANVVGGEAVNGKNLLNECIRIGIELTMADLGKYTSAYFKHNTIVDYIKAGEFTSNYMPAIPFKRGIVIQKTKTNMQRLVIKSVDILVNTNATNKILEIQDFFYPYPASNSQVPYKVTPITIPQLNAGQILTIPIAYTALGNYVRIVMDNINLQVNDGIIGGGYGSKTCCGGSRTTVTNTDLSVFGWNGVSAEGRAFGIVADAIVECDEGELFCLVKDKLRMLLLYRAGVEFAKRWLFSERMTKNTMYEFERAKATTLVDRFEMQYKSFYESAGKSLRAWLTNYDCACINCTGYSFGYVTG